MDKYLLLYEIKRHGYTMSDVAKAIGISKSAFSKKMNGKSEFMLSEIRKIMKVLDLESPIPIFFAKEVS